MKTTEWKVGDETRIATMTNLRWGVIIEISHGTATVIMEDGHIQYWGIGSLETRESYLRSCERMRDEWTGAHYRKMVELADRPFVKHPNWTEWYARATAPV